MSIYLNERSSFMLCCKFGTLTCLSNFSLGHLGTYLSALLSLMELKEHPEIPFFLFYLFVIFGKPM